MLRTALALSLALSASAAHALEMSPVCKALHGLGDAARASGQPQRVTLTGPTCDRGTPGPATAQFCAALLGADSGAAPWLLRGCVQTLAADAQVTTGKAPSGFGEKREITRLVAKLGGGVRLDVQGTKDRYELVVWKRD